MSTSSLKPPPLKGRSTRTKGLINEPDPATILTYRNKPRWQWTAQDKADHQAKLDKDFELMASWLPELKREDFLIKMKHSAYVGKIDTEEDSVDPPAVQETQPEILARLDIDKVLTEAYVTSEEQPLDDALIKESSRISPETKFNQAPDQPLNLPEHVDKGDYPVGISVTAQEAAVLVGKTEDASMEDLLSLVSGTPVSQITLPWATPTGNPKVREIPPLEELPVVKKVKFGGLPPQDMEEEKFLPTLTKSEILEAASKPRLFKTLPGISTGGSSNKTRQKLLSDFQDFTPIIKPGTPFKNSSNGSSPSRGTVYDPGIETEEDVLRDTT